MTYMLTVILLLLGYFGLIALGISLGMLVERVWDWYQKKGN